MYDTRIYMHRKKRRRKRRKTMVVARRAYIAAYLMVQARVLALLPPLGVTSPMPGARHTLLPSITDR